MLARAIDVALVGDYSDVPVVDRILSLIEESGTQELRQFAAVAHFIRTVYERVAPLIRVMDQAASTDPALPKLRTRLVGSIHADCPPVITQVLANLTRVLWLSPDEAANAMVTIMSPICVFHAHRPHGLGPPDFFQEWIVHAFTATAPVGRNSFVV